MHERARRNTLMALCVCVPLLWCAKSLAGAGLVIGMLVLLSVEGEEEEIPFRTTAEGYQCPSRSVSGAIRGAGNENTLSVG